MIEPRANYNILGCGATVVKNLGDPDQDPCEMVKTLLGKVRIRFTFYTMADCQPKKLCKDTSGLRLKKYIQKHNLGQMIETKGRHFSDIVKDNYIKIYVWRPDYAGKDFQKWCIDNKVTCIRRDVY